MPPLPTVRTFVPEQWGQIDLFRKFHPGTHQLDKKTRKALSGVGNHLSKGILLHDLAMRMAPNLKIDRQELEARGYSPALYARELSAVVESIFLELYSSVDCARRVVTFIYKRCRGVPESTRKFFFRMKSGEISGEFPQILREAVLRAHWFEELMKIRDELTHSDVGYCRLDPQTKRISYTHPEVNEGGKPLVVEDVFRQIAIFFDQINAFFGEVFRYLNTQLRPYEVDQMCGVFFGRGYLRKLTLAPTIDINSGVCQSRTWFDAAPEYRCPFAEHCGAYLATDHRQA